MAKETQLLSRADFAKAQGVSRQMIDKYVKSGMPLQDGRVDPKQAGAWIERNVLSRSKPGETFAEAERKRQEAQPLIDRAAADYEDACLRRHAAGALCDGTPQARIEALDAEVARTRAERDRVLAEAEEPYREALRTMLDFDRHFISAASSWLAQIIRDYGDADKRLVDLCQPTRRKLEDLAHKRVPLREIADFFQPVFEEVSAWKLPKLETVAYGVPHPPSRFNVPRLSDWLEK